jgi:L-asparaginase
MQLPKLVIHGGIFTNLGAFTEYHLERKLHEALVSIAQQTFEVLCSYNARSAVVHGIRYLEDEPLFNAGTGSLLQSDGEVRMSAALMDSESRRFSGVINIQNVKNPIDVADLLAKEKNTVLAGELATRYAREQGFTAYDPITPSRRIWYEKTCLPENGTVGIVALDAKGIICAGTSTGGIGCEIPGRVSDSATIAGTYASNAAGVSCTGIGEHIINEGVAIKIVTLVEAGLPLRRAVNQVLEEGKHCAYRFGLISIDAEGHIIVDKTIDQDYEVVYASYDGQILNVFP